MNLLTTHVLIYLYWILLLLVTTGSLAAAILAFRTKRQPYAIVSAGALAAALFIAAVPVQPGLTGFGLLLGLIALALAVVGGSPLAMLVLSLATKNSVPQGSHGGILVEDGVGPVPDAAVPETAPAAVHEVLRGGVTIGILERLAVAGAILAGFPEAIAVVVAIKGVGRFTELASAEARERFIIGTLASLIWACACAALVQLAFS